MKLIAVVGLFDRPKEKERNLDNFMKFEKNITLFEVLFLGYRKLS